MVRLGDVSATPLTCQIVGCEEEAAGWCQTAELPPRPAMLDLCEQHMGMLRGDFGPMDGPVAERPVLTWTEDGPVFTALWTPTP